MPQKKTISAREVVADIRVGMSDDQLMQKHGLSAKGLQSLINKLIQSGLISQEEFSQRGGNGGGARPQQAKLPAAQIANDLKAGVPDDQIVKKYGIPAAKLPMLYDKLVRAGLVTQAELDQRSAAFEETVDLDPEAATLEQTTAPSRENAKDVLMEFASRFKISNEDLNRLKSASFKDLRGILAKYNIPIKEAKELLPVLGLKAGDLMSGTADKLKSKTSQWLDKAKGIAQSSKEGVSSSGQVVATEAPAQESHVHKGPPPPPEVITAFVKAAEYGKLDEIKSSLEGGIDVNAQDPAGCTALMSASHSGQTEAVELLLSYNADIALRDNQGRTAFELAAAAGKNRVAELIKEDAVKKREIYQAKHPTAIWAQAVAALMGGWFFATWFTDSLLWFVICLAIFGVVCFLTLLAIADKFAPRNLTKYFVGAACVLLLLSFAVSGTSDKGIPAPSGVKHADPGGIRGNRGATVEGKVITGEAYRAKWEELARKYGIDTNRVDLDYIMTPPTEVPDDPRNIYLIGIVRVVRDDGIIILSWGDFQYWAMKPPKGLKYSPRMNQRLSAIGKIVDIFKSPSRSMVIVEPAALQTDSPEYAVYY